MRSFWCLMAFAWAASPAVLGQGTTLNEGLKTESLRTAVKSFVKKTDAPEVMALSALDALKVKTDLIKAAEGVSYTADADAAKRSFAWTYESTEALSGENEAKVITA